MKVADFAAIRAANSSARLQRNHSLKKMKEAKKTKQHVPSSFPGKYLEHTINISMQFIFPKRRQYL